jgi:hypothetical protein
VLNKLHAGHVRNDWRKAKMKITHRRTNTGYSVEMHNVHNIKMKSESIVNCHSFPCAF